MGASCCTVRDAAEFLISEALSPASATVVASPIRALGYSVKPSSEIIECPPIKFESPKSGRLYRLLFPGDLRRSFAIAQAAKPPPLADPWPTDMTPRLQAVISRRRWRVV